MRAGEANRFLLDWVMENRASWATTLLVQEGIWVAMDAYTGEGLDIRRIHRHDPNVYINTLDTAVCALQQLEQAGEKDSHARRT